MRKLLFVLLLSAPGLVWSASAAIEWDGANLEVTNLAAGERSNTGVLGNRRLHEVWPEGVTN